MKKNVSFILIMIFLISFPLSTLGERVSPFANEVFMLYEVSLSQSNSVRIRCETRYVVDSIKTPRCSIQKQDGENWVRVKSIANPCVAYNTKRLLETKDFSAYIGSGTYRIVVTFNADGAVHTVTSKAVTF